MIRKTKPLPIDGVLDDLRRALCSAQAAVLQAEPGAGKTTRVPLALLDEPWLEGKRIVMLEPRRLAATNAARYMARCLAEPVGRTVGYTIRFERQVSAATRLEVVTEGILTRRLQADPMLEGVGLIIFDEFHERNLHSDLALALARDAQLGLREDLRLLIMSATLDAEPVARMLGDAPLLACPGRRHPVAVSYLPHEPRGPLAEVAARAVRRAVREAEGDILVFLPGAAEIRRCRELLEGEPVAGQLEIFPLYGDLPFARQEQALMPAARRKVVLATNIAETSLTIEGVRVVIDSGFMRQARFDAAAGLPRLVTTRITAANAEQRAGRAGRTAPGRCYRLWTEAVQSGLMPYAPPEIRSADLAQLALELARWGVRRAEALTWLDPPPEGALAAARALLRELGALDTDDRLTVRGDAMAKMPAHPRVAALLVRAQEAGCLSAGAALAALLEERDVLHRARRAADATSSDLWPRLEVLRALRRGRAAPAGADPAACRAALRSADAWCRRLRCTVQDSVPDERALGLLLLAAYPDRLALRRAEDGGRYLLIGGRGCRLSPTSGVRGAQFVLAVKVGGGGQSDAVVYLASAVERSLVEEFFADRLQWQRRVAWDAARQRVEACEEYRLGALVLRARPVSASADELAAALLDGVRQGGLRVLPWSEATEQLRCRVMTLARCFPRDGWPDWSDAALVADLDAWLGPWLAGLRGMNDLARLDLVAVLRGTLDWSQQQRLETLAPTHLTVPSGHRVALAYQLDGPPVLAVKLQELFGQATTPCIAGGRLAVQLHLLSPARRPVAVTQDLASFWDGVYPEVRRELAGRYPKHPWPDDPWRAVPTRATKRRATRRQ